MALSLFGGKKHLHHFVAEQDVAKELFALLVEAKTMYLRDVVTGNKQYYRYVEDFVNSHRYIDCDHAVCRNCHEMNIHILVAASCMASSSGTRTLSPLRYIFFVISGTVSCRA